MKLAYCCYVFYIIESVLCMKLKCKKRNNVFFLNNYSVNVINIVDKNRKKRIISTTGLFKKEKKDGILKRNNIRKIHLYSNKKEKEGNDNNVDINDDILVKKKNEKEVEQSLIPLNMDWIKVMNLIYSSKEVDATTLAFNAAISAVEKKGCLVTVLDLLETMKRKNIKPDLVSYKLILSLCEKYHLAENAEIIFEEMIETDKLTPTYEIYALMISCFSKMGNGFKAIEFFEKLRNDPFVEEMKNININNDKEKLEKWKDAFAQNELVEEGTEIENSGYNTHFKEISQKIKNTEKASSKIQYSEYANVIFACNMSNLLEQGIKYFEELLNSDKYLPSIFVYENIFDLLGKNGNYQKCLEYYNKLKDDPNLKKNLNVNILNNVLKALSIYNKINIIEDIWNNEFDELLLTPNSISYQILLQVYGNIDDYEKSFKLFKEMHVKKLLNNKNILPFLYTINAFKNCGIYNYAIYVLRIAKLLAVSGNDLLMLYNNTMISCMNSKKYDIIISLYAELITLQEKENALEINMNTLSFVLLAFKELKMHEDFTNLKNLIIQKNYKLTPLGSKLINETPDS
ncbi:pentatricopeptide repeat-containing protein 1 [Plasmodium brasilianum]|uniref:Pentatricopeptide repeat-containing protein 1 n=1 Tax=Plasmodium brasilianum TaxID=5824 RepID=A0ACB9Y4N7_PLABR|nr:pentatricopeptide repeat-containing protein 1 [Plasmodium brasilianum]